MGLILFFAFAMFIFGMCWGKGKKFSLILAGTGALAGLLLVLFFNIKEKTELLDFFGSAEEKFFLGDVGLESHKENFFFFYYPKPAGVVARLNYLIGRIPKTCPVVFYSEQEWRGYIIGPSRKFSDPESIWRNWLLFIPGTALDGRYEIHIPEGGVEVHRDKDS